MSELQSRIDQAIAILDAAEGSSEYETFAAVSDALDVLQPERVAAREKARAEWLQTYIGREMEARRLAKEST